MNGKESGFTVIEMAVVLLILGLIIGIGVSLIGPLTDADLRASTPAPLPPH